MPKIVEKFLAQIKADPNSAEILWENFIRDRLNGKVNIGEVDLWKNLADAVALLPIKAYFYLLEQLLNLSRESRLPLCAKYAMEFNKIFGAYTSLQTKNLKQICAYVMFVSFYRAITSHDSMSRPAQARPLSELMVLAQVLPMAVEDATLLQSLLTDLCRNLVDEAKSNPVPFLCLIQMHLHEIGMITVSRKQAMEWLEQAADNYAPAQYRYGLCLLEGLGIAKDLKKAVLWFRKAAESGYSTALVALGRCYRKGIGVQIDHVAATANFKKAAELGNSAGQDYMGIGFSSGGGIAKDYSRAADFFLKSAAQGNAVAQCHYANLLQRNRGIQFDLKKTTFLYLKAKLQGHDEPTGSLEKLIKSHSAQVFGFAVDLLFGDKIKKDVRLACALLTLMQKNEVTTISPELMSMISKVLSLGEGIEDDQARAMFQSWDTAPNDQAANDVIQSFADQMSPAALYNLACHLEEHVLSNENFNLAKILKLSECMFQTLALKGHVGAQFSLAAHLQRQGRLQEAHAWYEKAADKGHVIAQYYLGKLFREFFFNDADRYRFLAIAWIWRASKGGCVQAMKYLEPEMLNLQGVCYLIYSLEEKEETYLPKSNVDAIKWFAKEAAWRILSDEDKKTYPALEHLPTKILFLRLAQMLEKENGQVEGGALEWYFKAAEKGSVAANMNKDTHDFLAFFPPQARVPAVTLQERTAKAPNQKLST